MQDAHPPELAVVSRFIAAINAHDVSAIVDLCSADHLFVDAHGNSVTRDHLVQAWRAYFVFMPVHGIDVETMFAQDGVVALFGWAWGELAGSRDGARRWRRPAAWRAVVRAGRIASWQVYSDTKIVFDLAEGRA